MEKIAPALREAMETQSDEETCRVILTLEENHLPPTTLPLEAVALGFGIYTFDADHHLIRALAREDSVAALELDQNYRICG